jgi:hypothetical protein
MGKLHLGPLTGRALNLCVDMQRLFSGEGPWATPWMDADLGSGLHGRPLSQTIDLTLFRIVCLNSPRPSRRGFHLLRHSHEARAPREGG